MLKWRPGKTLLFKFCAIALSVLCVFAGLEIVLRGIGYHPSYVNPLRSFHENDPVLGWRGKRNFTGRFVKPWFDVEIAHDENGFRKQVVQNEPSADAKRIIFYGDSFTWGWGVEQGKTVTDRLRVLLPAYKVINRGINASGTVMQYTLFNQEFSASLSPGDTVILLFFYNDYSDNVDDSGGRLSARIKDDAVVLVPPSHVLSESRLSTYSYLLNFLHFKINTLKLHYKTLHALDRSHKMKRIGEADPSVAITKHFLSKFQEDCHRREAEFLLAYIPGQAEMKELNSNMEEQLHVEESFRAVTFKIAKDLNLKTLDFLPAFFEYKRQNPSTLLTFQIDQHWNEHGHELAAQAICQYLREEWNYPDPSF